jgi:hypothetical protein
METFPTEMYTKSQNKHDGKMIHNISTIYRVNKTDRSIHENTRHNIWTYFGTRSGIQRSIQMHLKLTQVYKK